MLSRAALFITIAIVAAGLLFPGSARAHNVSKRDATFVQSNKGAAIVPFMYLGAKHMVTGYDHLAFLVGDWSSSSAIQLSPSQIRTCGFPA